jgi:hypothetical protein
LEIQAKNLFPASQKTLLLNYKEHVTATYGSSGSFELRTQSAPTIALFYIVKQSLYRPGVAQRDPGS